MAWSVPTPLEISSIEQLETAHIKRNEISTPIDSRKSVLDAELYLGKIAAALNTPEEDREFLEKPAEQDYYEQSWIRLEKAHGSKVLGFISPEGHPLNRPDTLPPSFARKER